MNENRRMLIWLGFFTMLTAVFITYLALKIGGINVGDQQRFRLVFDNATGIPDNADVRVSGIKVGMVTDMDLADEGGAEVWIGVEPRIAVHTDARAVIKSKSLLGERFIELQPGAAAGTIDSGATITNTVTPLRVEDLGEIMGPLLEGVDPAQVQVAFQAIVDVIVENREAIADGAAAFSSALQRVAEMINDPEEMARLERFMRSLSDLTVRLDRISRDNEAAIGETLADTRAMMADLRDLTTGMREVAAEHPKAATDALEILSRLNRISADLEQIDGKKVGLILKTVLQQEGLTFSVRGYNQDELKAQMDAYEQLYDGEADVVVPSHGGGGEESKKALFGE